jgi:alkyldihydroxyacetonephosphate synthase
MAQDGPLPAVVRLSDEAETAIGGGGGGCLVIVGYEGSSVTVEARRQAVSAHLTRAGATTVPGAGDGWARDRYRGPYLRDSLLDAGALVETLETATFWSSLEPLYDAVTTALRDSLTAQGTPPVILGHVSHVYPSGASLYFTVACAQAGDPGAQWRQAKAAASEAILAAGGSISHHHGVGRDHVEWLEREVGSLSTALLRAAKRTVDPAGILNPGILVSTER